MRDADKRGVQLSQTALARLLRARGLSIPNQRLRWLAAAARTKASVSRGPEDTHGSKTSTG
jgi:hypothetical protein